MIKNSLKNWFINNEYEELLNFVLANMSDDKRPQTFTTTMSDEEFDFRLNDVQDVIGIVDSPSSSPQYQSEEDRHQIDELVQQLKTSQKFISISLDPLNESEQSLLNPSDTNLLNSEPVSCMVSIPENRLSPLSPLTQACNQMDTLSIQTGNVTSTLSTTNPTNNEEIVGSVRTSIDGAIGGNFYRDPINYIPEIGPNNYDSNSMMGQSFSEVQTVSMGQSIRGQPSRIRFDSSGAYTLNDSSLVDTSSQMFHLNQSRRTGHSTQPYLRSQTDPLPQLIGNVSTYGAELQLFSQSINTSNHYLYDSGEPIPQPFARSISEPEFSQRCRPTDADLEYRVPNSGRGRPPTRTHQRKSLTARERFLQIKAKETELEITKFQNEMVVDNLLSERQQLIEELRRIGMTDNYLKSKLSQLN